MAGEEEKEEAEEEGINLLKKKKAKPQRKEAGEGVAVVEREEEGVGQVIVTLRNLIKTQIPQGEGEEMIEEEVAAAEGIISQSLMKLRKRKMMKLKKNPEDPRRDRKGECKRICVLNQ